MRVAIMLLTRTMLVTMAMSRTVLMQAATAFRTLEFMAFAGHTEYGNRDHKRAKNFHRRDPYPSPRQRAIGMSDHTPRVLSPDNHPATTAAAFSCAPSPPNSAVVAASSSHNFSLFADESNNARNSAAIRSGRASP